jgi:hypothetical protein
MANHGRLKGGDEGVERETVESNCLFGAVLVPIVLALVVFLSGCSVRAEFGYHGQTGRDDRIQTELVNAEERRLERPVRWGDEKKTTN